MWVLGGNWSFVEALRNVFLVFVAAVFGSTVGAGVQIACRWIGNALTRRP
jgi:hypothetical protein